MKRAAALQHGSLNALLCTGDGWNGIEWNGKVAQPRGKIVGVRGLLAEVSTSLSYLTLLCLPKHPSFQPCLALFGTLQLSNVINGVEQLHRLFFLIEED